MTTPEFSDHKFFNDTHHHHHHLLFPTKSSMIRDFDNYLPPRKLLTRHAAAKTAVHHHDVAGAGDMFADSPRFSPSDETLLRKFLPHNNPESDDSDDDPYSSEHFRMYEFKIRRCNRSRSHDWTDCPFAHPGEKARRRDPRKYHYSGTVCSEYRRSGTCRRGDSCEYAHGVFECWLHPARYKTEACKDGKNCKRKVCFFAHSPRQLRILPLNSSVSSSSDHQISDMNNNNNNNNNKFLKPSKNNCCMFCHCSVDNNNVNNSSPTSTLFGMSHFSPPSSPASPIKAGTSVNGLSPICGYNNNNNNNNKGMVMMSYRDVLNELMNSVEVLNFNNEASSSDSTSHEIFATTTCNNNQTPNLHWLEVSGFNCDDDLQFIPSPSSHRQIPHQKPTVQSASMKFSAGGKSFDDGDGDGDDNDNGSSSCATPDLGWVNDLLV